LRIGRNGEHVLLDNFEIITRTTSIVASNNDRVDIEAGERNTFSYQYDYSQDERTTARYDLRIQQDTNGRRTETTLSETHARGTTVIIDDDLRDSVNVNIQPLDLSVSMTNNGFVNYFLTDERGATVIIGSSMTIPNAEASGDIIGLAGQFTLTAVHTDNWGRQVSDNTTIRLFSDAPPVAILELPVEKILQGALLNLSGLQSTDDNGIVEYDWRISGPEEYSFNTSEISFTPTTLGVYQVRLVVSDEWGQSDILLSNFSVSSSDYEAVDLPDDPNVDLPDDPNSSTSSESDILMGIFGLLFLVLLISAVRNRRRQ
jgi:hypothetical protein